MNRIEMRNYYRKCAGYLGMMGAILMFTLSCLAIYISDFSEINGVEEGTGVVMLNCLYLYCRYRFFHHYRDCRNHRGKGKW